MSNNEKAMSIEDKLVQHMKSDTIGKLVDEDALVELAKRAIHESLFKERIVDNGSYNGRKVVQSPVVQAANDVADKLCGDAAKEILAQLMNDDGVREAVLEAISIALPQAILNGLSGAYRNAMEIQSNHAVQTLRIKLHDAGIKVQP